MYRCDHFLVLLTACATLTFMRGSHAEFADQLIQGKVVVASIPSLIDAEGTFWTGIASPYECSKYCRALPGCNAYAFCNSYEGCPRHCSEEVRLNPKVDFLPGTHSLDITTLPIKGVGPYFAGCLGGPDGTLWPQGTCTLMLVADPSSPTFEDHGEGWTSGVVPLPSPCGPEVSAAACQRCLASLDEEECLRCAEQRPVPAKDIVTSWGITLEEDYFRTGQEQCGICAAIAAVSARGQCLACVVGDQPCGRCIDHLGDAQFCVECTHRTGRPDTCGLCSYYSSSKDRRLCERCQVGAKPCAACTPLGHGSDIHNIPECVECVERTGLALPCVGCTQSYQQDVTGCVHCVHSLSRRFCQDPEQTGDPSCIPQMTLICPACLDLGDGYEECVKCAREEVPFDYWKCVGLTRRGSPSVV